MLDFNVERFKRLPVQPGLWQGGLFRMPAWVKGEDEKPFRPWIALWVDPHGPRISQVGYVENENPYQVALDSLIAFALESERKAYRPFAVEVKDAELAAFLRERLQSNGVRVDCVTSLPVMQRCLDDFAEHMTKRKEPPGLLDGETVTIELAGRFAESAARFYRARLWEELSDDDLIEVLRPAPPPGMRYVGVLGHAGQAFGLGFFASLKEYEKLCSASSPGGFFAKNGTWSLTFDDVTMLPFADADLWEDHGLPLAGPKAYPCPLWFGPKRQTRRPDACELAFLEGLLRVLAETTVAEMDAGRWSRSVVVGEKAAAYHLALVNEVDEPAKPVGFPLHPHHFRRAMEQGMANLQRVMGEHEFSSVGDANAFIHTNLDKEAPPRTPLEQAQELVYEAWEGRGRRPRKLARKALEICADCADVYVLLAEDTSDPAKACELFRKGVAAGERALGPDIFKKEVGRFWGILETRPYMRSRVGLAQTLWALGQQAEAVSHYEELLRLNPGDNQGIRYLLAACLLELGDNKKLGKLLKANAEDATAQWAYLRALWCYRREGDTPQARKTAKEAIESNRHVPDFLSGRRRLPQRIPEAFHLGHEDEAICCASEIRSGWKATPGALDWLANVQHGVGDMAT